MLKQQGQSAVEFMLIAPVLFLLFFGIIQLFYSAFVSFAVQKATHAIAQQAAASATPTLFEPHFQIITALSPLEKLNNSTLLYALASKCDIQEKNNRVFATVTYPMPIWVPLIGKVIGQPFDSSKNSILSIATNLTNLLSTLGLALPGFPIPSNSINVIWITFQAYCLDENIVGAHS
jgi:hypothetical protein